MPVRLLRAGLKDSIPWNSLDWAAQSFYVRLLNLVDDYGRYEADLRLLKGHAFAMRQDVTLLTIANMCVQLKEGGMATFYQHSDGKVYLQLSKWQERARSASKYPDPSDSNCKQLPTIDDKCLLPTPSPSPSPSTSPAPSPDAGACEQLPVELPPGFPKTLNEALEQAKFVGCLESVCTKAYNKAVSRGGRDSKDVPIRNFRGYLASEMAYQREHEAKDSKKSKTGKPW